MDFVIYDVRFYCNGYFLPGGAAARFGKFLLLD